MSEARDSVMNTVLVAIGLSLVCSVLVSGTAVLLKPQQLENQSRYRQKIILEVAGLFEPGVDIEEMFVGIESRLVDLASGDYVDPIAASDILNPLTEIPEQFDIANIRQRATYVPVYIVREGDSVEQIVLPVYGSGLWSTMYGYLVLAGDGSTVRGLRFYEHAETPGLGDGIDDADWRDMWPGKRIFGNSGGPRIEVVRGRVRDGEAAIHQVDGLSGATLTSRGVSNLLRYWTGPHGFGPFLDRFRNETDGND